MKEHLKHPYTWKATIAGVFFGALGYIIGDISKMINGDIYLPFVFATLGVLTGVVVFGYFQKRHQESDKHEQNSEIVSN